MEIAYLGQVAVYDDATYDVILSNRRQCRDAYTSVRAARLEKCVIHYSFESRSLGRPEPFEPVLEYMGIDPVGRNLFVRGLDPELKKERIVHRTANHMTKNLLVDEPAIETISWSDSESYIYRRPVSRAKSSTTINYALFDESASMKFNATVEYPGDVKLLKTTRSGRGAIYLLTEMANCVGDECWTLLFTQIDGDLSETLEYPCKCNGKTGSISSRDNRFYPNVLSYICLRCDDEFRDKHYVSYETIDWNHVTIPKMTLKNSQ